MKCQTQRHTANLIPDGDDDRDDDTGKGKVNGKNYDDVYD